MKSGGGDAGRMLKDVREWCRMFGWICGLEEAYTGVYELKLMLLMCFGEINSAGRLVQS